MFCWWSVERRIPVIDPFDGERTLPEGERLKLICKASGSPRPVLYWYREGRLVDEISHHSRYHPGRSTLAILARAYDTIYFAVVVNRNIAGRLEIPSAWVVCLTRSEIDQRLRHTTMIYYSFLGAFMKFEEITV